MAAKLEATPPTPDRLRHILKFHPRDFAGNMIRAEIDLVFGLNHLNSGTQDFGHPPKELGRPQTPTPTRRSGV